MTLIASRETVMDVCYTLYGVDDPIVLGSVTVTPNVISMYNEDNPDDLFYISNKPTSFIVEGQGVGRETTEKLRLLAPSSLSCDDYLVEVDAARQIDGTHHVFLSL